MKQKLYSSKEDFENKNPYVLVHFETIAEKTVTSIVKSFTNKKTADNYIEKHGLSRHHEIMTRKNFYKNALMCM